MPYIRACMTSAKQEIWKQAREVAGHKQQRPEQEAGVKSKAKDQILQKLDYRH